MLPTPTVMGTPLLLLALGLSVAACDSTGPEPPGGPDDPVPGDPAPDLPAVRVESRVGLSPRLFNVHLDEKARVGQFYYPFSDDSTEFSALYAGSLWMSGRQSGSLRVAAVTYGPTTYGPCPDVESRVFIVDAETTYSPEGWPADVGAPTATDGSPRAYGDEMAWTTTCSQAAQQYPNALPPFLDQPFDGLRVNAALFGHDAYQHVVFVRYEIRNESAAPITDAYAGFWSDPDLVGPGDNLIGVDPEARLAYVYLDTKLGISEEERPARDRGHVSGVVILETPGESPLAAHRMIDKHLGPFGQRTVDSFEDYAFALRGLDNDGNPMVNPLTGQPATFAYTGDPVGLTGWLDGFDYCGVEGDVQCGEEVRHLISAGTFTLEPGEAGVFTVAYLYQFGNGLAEGLGRLRQDAERLRSRPALWQFPVQ